MKKEIDIFTLPEIFRGKVWYIHFYYTNPDGKRIRFRIKGKLNSIVDLDEKETMAAKMQQEIYEKLKIGWSPFGDTVARTRMPELTTMFDAIQEVLTYKKNSLESYAQFSSRVKYFKEWLAKNNLLVKSPSVIEANHIFRFLNEIQNRRNLQARTRNNILTDIRSLFSCMMEFGIITTNPCSTIKKLNARSTQHKAYNDADMVRIRKWLENNDMYLSLFIKFIMMGMRRSEAVRVQVGNIDLKRGVIIIPSRNEKTNKSKVKIIFKKWIPIFEALRLDEYPPNYYFFTCNKKPGPTPTTADWFTKRFKEAKKELRLDRSYTLYGFRHTTAIALLKAGADLKDIMNITGHTTLQAFQHYVQQYLEEAPKDVSDLLKFNF